MFFAEALERGIVPRSPHHLDALLASSLGVAYSAALHPPGLLRPTGRWTSRANRTSGAIDAPARSKILVIACLVVGIAPAMTVGPYLQAAALSVLGPATPAALAWSSWHGIDGPLVMSAMALARERPSTKRSQQHRVTPGPPDLKGQRIEKTRAGDLLVAVAARALRATGTERLQAQLSHPRARAGLGGLRLRPHR